MAEWLGSITCHCGNTGVEWTLKKSQHTKLTLEKKILLPLLPRFKLATFPSWVWHSYGQAIQVTSYPGCVIYGNIHYTNLHTQASCMQARMCGCTNAHVRAHRHICIQKHALTQVMTHTHTHSLSLSLSLHTIAPSDRFSFCTCCIFTTCISNFGVLKWTETEMQKITPNCPVFYEVYITSRKATLDILIVFCMSHLSMCA